MEEEEEEEEGKESGSDAGLSPPSPPWRCIQGVSGLSVMVRTRPGTQPRMHEVKRDGLRAMAVCCLSFPSPQRAQLPGNLGSSTTFRTAVS